MGKADSKFGITTIIVNDILLKKEEIVELIDDRIFPVVADKDTVGDFVTYQRDRYSIEATQMGVSNQQCEVMFNVFSESYDKSQKIAEIIAMTLVGSWNSPTMSIRLADSTEDFEDGKFKQILLFEIN